MPYLRLTEHTRSLVPGFSQEIEFYRLVLRHPKTPRASRLLLGAAIAYAASPIDLIPDFIPVIGHLDDLIMVPLLIWLATRLIAEDVITQCRIQGSEQMNGGFHVGNQDSQGLYSRLARTGC
jgi:uncharacterized membrane protein YkvA (DUF1232 family)